MRIGICSPSAVQSRDDIRVIKGNLEARGFDVKIADNVFSSSYGYGASSEERAEDFMNLACDDEVDVVFFGGGEGGNEILPYLDFERIKEKPKKYLGFSDGTTLLNAIWANTGIEVYYGQSPSDYLLEPNGYTWRAFEKHIVKGGASEHERIAPWTCCNGGRAEGILFGGYLRNVALMIDNRYFQIDRNEEYILFVEDHEQLGGLDYVSSLLSHIEQNEIIDRIKGILFGQYSVHRHPELYERIRRFGEDNGIPASCCDDFGHGSIRGIMHIGRRAVLDADSGELRYIK